MWLLQVKGEVANVAQVKCKVWDSAPSLFTIVNTWLPMLDSSLPLANLARKHPAASMGVTWWPQVETSLLQPGTF